MGQRVSITEDLGGVILSKKGTEISSGNEESKALIDVEKGQKNSGDAAASAAAEKPRQLESGDPPMPAAAQKDDVEAGNSSGLSPADPAAAFDPLNPSGIAELSHLTALRMMRNFEGLSRIDDLFLSHVNEIHERMLEDNLSEKDFRTISYESLPISDFHDPAGSTEISKRDTSTYTHDLIEAEANDYRECIVNSCPALTTADDIPCKRPLTPGESIPAHEIKASARPAVDAKNPRKIHLPVKPGSGGEGEGGHPPPAEESSKQRGDGPDEPGFHAEQSPPPAGDEAAADDDEDGEAATTTADAEMRRLREALERLECERDVARMRLLIAEDKCKSYEEESRCLEATLGSMETKLRSMASELREEVRNSRQLQHKLSEALRSAGDSVSEPPLETAA